MFQVFSIDIAPDTKDKTAVFLWYLDSSMISQSTTAAICESRRKRLFVLPFASFDVEELDFVGVARTEPTANEQDLSGRNLRERITVGRTSTVLYRAQYVKIQEKKKRQT